MLKHLLPIAFILSLNTAFSQETDSWSTYLQEDELKISVKTNDCDYPEKGVNNRFLFFKFENLSSSTLTISYDVERSYNGKQLKADSNGFKFNVPANGSIQGDCSDLKPGLHLFSKMLNAPAKSNLTDFKLSNIVVNGKNIVR